MVAPLGAGSAGTAGSCSGAGFGGEPLGPNPLARPRWAAAGTAGGASVAGSATGAAVTMGSSGWLVPVSGTGSAPGCQSLSVSATAETGATTFPSGKGGAAAAGGRWILGLPRKGGLLLGGPLLVGLGIIVLNGMVCMAPEGPSDPAIGPSLRFICSREVSNY